MKKLTDNQARVIRDLYENTEISAEALAKEFGVSTKSIEAILSNRTHHQPDFDEKAVGYRGLKLRDLMSEVIELRGEGKSYDHIGVELANRHGRVKQRVEGKAWSGSSVREALKKYMENRDAAK